MRRGRVDFPGRSLTNTFRLPPETPGSNAGALARVACRSSYRFTIVFENTSVESDRSGTPRTSAAGAAARPRGVLLFLGTGGPCRAESTSPPPSMCRGRGGAPGLGHLLVRHGSGHVRWVDEPRRLADPVVPAWWPDLASIGSVPCPARATAGSALTSGSTWERPSTAGPGRTGRVYRQDLARCRVTTSSAIGRQSDRSPKRRARCTASSRLRAFSFAKMLRTW